MSWFFVAVVWPKRPSPGRFGPVQDALNHAECKRGIDSPAVMRACDRGSAIILRQLAIHQPPDLPRVPVAQLLRQRKIRKILKAHRPGEALDRLRAHRS